MKFLSELNCIKNFQIMEKKPHVNKTHRKVQNRIEKKSTFWRKFSRTFFQKPIDISKKGSIILM